MKRKYPNMVYIVDLYNERRSSSANKTFFSRQTLKKFGAHDRTSFKEEDEDNVNIIQVLELMNGTVAQYAIDQKSYVLKEVLKKRSFNDRVKVAVVSVFGRWPVDSDIKHAKKYISILNKKGLKKDQAWRQYLIAMLSSPEFIFIL